MVPFAVGASYESKVSFAAQEVRAFAELSGDFNPIHLDEAVAKAAGFGGCIVHGLLMGAVFSRILGTEFPGKGAIYLHQSLNFGRPLLVGEGGLARITVIARKADKPIYTLSTEILRESDNEVCVKGEAVIKYAAPATGAA